jgi:hypothetical protein
LSTEQTSQLKGLVAQYGGFGANATAKQNILFCPPGFYFA